MDFTNYTGLQAAIADYLNRDDLNSGGQIAGFIALAEARMRRTLRRTTVIAAFNVTSGNNAQSLPADCAELRGVSVAPCAALPRGATLAETTYDDLLGQRALGPSTGLPRFYAVEGGVLYLAPAPADAYLGLTLRYFSQLVPLSGSNPTNAVLLEAPDAYLYGSCLEAAPYLEHDERISIWEPAFTNTIDELNDVRQREEFGASLQKARLPMSF